MNILSTTPSYVLITGANSLSSKRLALNLAKSGHHLILIGNRHGNLIDWAQRLVLYGIDVAFFEIDNHDPISMALLADWIYSSYSISHFHNHGQIAWMDKLFETGSERKLA